MVYISDNIINELPATVEFKISEFKKLKPLKNNSEFEDIENPDIKELILHIAGAIFVDSFKEPNSKLLNSEEIINRYVNVDLNKMLLEYSDEKTAKKNLKELEDCLKEGFKFIKITRGSLLQLRSQGYP